MRHDRRSALRFWPRSRRWWTKPREAVQQLVDRVSYVFVPMVVVVAVLTLPLWALAHAFLGVNMPREGLDNLLLPVSILVVACRYAVWAWPRQWP